MYRLVGTWPAPAPNRVEEFEKHYAAVHAPRAAAVPGLRKILLTRTADGFASGEPAFYRLAEMFLDSPEATAESARLEEWHAMHEDAGYLIQEFDASMVAAAGWETDGTNDSGGAAA
jgi:uncharacterized protein (TIGR02118 family)